MASITITGNAGDFRLKSYIPEVYSPKLREKFWYSTVLRKITNTEYQGAFKKKGDTIIIRALPNIPTSRFVDGQKIVYHKPESYDLKYTIDKGLMYAFVVSDVQKAFSDIPNWAEKWTDIGAKQLAQDWETWLFGDWASGAKVDVANQGNAAGVKSGDFKLGTSVAPVSLYKTDAAAGNGTAVGGGDKTTAVELATRLTTVLEEQPGGAGMASFAVLPAWVAQLLQNSEVFQSADKMGDDTSILRKNAVTSLGKLAGMDIYVSNLLPSETVSGRKYWPILFGDQSAVTFADEVAITEVLRDKSYVGDFHRSIHIGDWFWRYPERAGVAWVTRGA